MIINQITLKNTSDIIHVIGIAHIRYYQSGQCLNDFMRLPSGYIYGGVKPAPGEEVELAGKIGLLADIDVERVEVDLYAMTPGQAGEIYIKGSNGIAIQKEAAYNLASGDSMTVNIPLPVYIAPEPKLSKGLLIVGALLLGLIIIRKRSRR